MSAGLASFIDSPCYAYLTGQDFTKRDPAFPHEIDEVPEKTGNIKQPPAGWINFCKCSKPMQRGPDTALTSGLRRERFQGFPSRDSIWPLVLRYQRMSGQDFGRVLSSY
jgi:hypothetical protein